MGCSGTAWHLVECIIITQFCQTILQYACAFIFCYLQVFSCIEQPETMISLSPNHELLAIVSGNNASFYLQKSAYNLAYRSCIRLMITYRVCEGVSW